MEQEKEYFVFISYSSLDNEWAIWLRHELEHYHLPASFNGRTDVRDNLRKVFRDRDELSAGPEWDEQVSKALRETNNLIVICSPNAAKSDAVNKEVETFIALGKEDHIFPFIVEGNTPAECFPRSLSHSKLGGDVNKDGGRDSAFIKVVAGMLKVGFPSLWDRYEKEKAEEERKIREQRDKLLIAQSRFISEKVTEVIKNNETHLARRLCLETLPTPEHNYYPYTPEAESALRKAFDLKSFNLKGHIDEIFNIQFRPDGKKLISASKDNSIRIWDLATGKCDLIVMGECDFMTYASFSPDGKNIAIAARDYYIHILDSDTGREIKRLDGVSSSLVESVVFSHRGTRIASFTRNGELSVWDIISEKKLFLATNVIKSFYPHYNISKLTSNIFSADDKYIIIPLDNGPIQVWNIEKKELYLTLEKENTKVALFASFSTNNEKILAVSENVIYIWNGKTGKIQEIIDEHKNTIRLAVFSPYDSNIILSVSVDGELCIHNIENGECVKKETISIRPQCFYFNSTDKFFIGSSDNKIITINEIDFKLSGKPIKTNLNNISDIVFSRDGSKLLSVSENEQVSIWDIQNEDIVYELDIKGKPLFMEVNSSTTKLFTINIADNVIKLRAFDLSTKECVLEFNGDDKAYEHELCLFTDGKRFASVCCTTVFIWNVYSMKKIVLSKTLAHKYGVNCMNFDASGGMFVTGTFDKTICVWNINSEKCIQTMVGHTSHIRSVNFSFDNKRIASASYDGTIRIWNIVDGSCLHTISIDTDNVMFSRDSTKFYSVVENCIYIWDAETAHLIQKIEKNIDERLAISSDLSNLAILSPNNVVRIEKNESIDELIYKTYNQYKSYLLTPEERKKYYLD